MKEMRIALFNHNGKPVKSFKNKAEAQNFCVENKICNAGWVSRSLETGEKFYYPQSRNSFSHNGYRGKGWYVKWGWVRKKSKRA